MNPVVILNRVIKLRVYGCDRDRFAPTCQSTLAKFPEKICSTCRSRAPAFDYMVERVFGRKPTPLPQNQTGDTCAIEVIYCR
jgi:hypothetical protein